MKKVEVIVLFLLIFSNTFGQVDSKCNLTNASLDNKKDTLIKKINKRS